MTLFRTPFWFDQLLGLSSLLDSWRVRKLLFSYCHVFVLAAYHYCLFFFKMQYHICSLFLEATANLFSDASSILLSLFDVIVVDGIEV